MPLTLEQKSDVRRHLGIVVGGLARNSPSGGTVATGVIGWRFHQTEGMLEYRLNNLAPDEESRLVGRAYGAVGISYSTLGAGNQLQVTVTGGVPNSPITVTYTTLTADTAISVAAGVANAFNNNANFVANGMQAIAPFGTGAFGQNFPQGNPSGNIAVPIAQVAVTNAASFTITATPTGMGAFITSNGLLLPPSVVTGPSNALVTTNGYLPILNLLEAAKYGSTNNLDTSRADVWWHDPQEISNRERLYKMVCRDMDGYLFGKNRGLGVMGHEGPTVALI
jgi:hypothetical protein